MNSTVRSFLARFRGPSSYQQRKTFAERYAEVKKVQAKYPGFVPIIVETELPLDKCKYLVHGELTLAECLATVRKRLTVVPSAGLFFFVGTTLALPTTRLRDLYLRHQNPDGFLYLNLLTENTFG